MSTRNSKKWAMRALFAAGIGYVVGLLTAPKSGKETRQDIQSAASKAKKDAEKKLKAAHKELGDLLDKGKDRATKLTKQAKDEYQNLSNRATNAKQRASELLSAIHEGEADDIELQKAIDEAKKASDHLRKFLASYDKKESKKG